MRYATAEFEGSTSAVRLEADTAHILDAADVGDLLRRIDTGAIVVERAVAPVADIVLRQTILRPEKIICVGLNYRSHIVEMGRDVPSHPTLFAKFADALTGPHSDIALPTSATSMDWEAELTVVVGKTTRAANVAQAETSIAGFCVANDITARDWQQRTTQWLQGKTFEATTPLGPVMVTTDEAGVNPDFRIRCSVGGHIVQDARTSDLVFSPAELVSYVSTIMTLRPGDIILTGTPGGVGQASVPPRYIRPGEIVETEIDGIGVLANLFVEQPAE